MLIWLRSHDIFVLIELRFTSSASTGLWQNCLIHATRVSKSPSFISTLRSNQFYCYIFFFFYNVREEECNALNWVTISSRREKIYLTRVHFYAEFVFLLANIKSIFYSTYPFPVFVFAYSKQGNGWKQVIGGFRSKHGELPVTVCSNPSLTFWLLVLL